MLIKLLRRLGVRLIIHEHCHNIRNATCSIAGIIKEMQARKLVRKNQLLKVLVQLKRIEESLNSVRRLNIGK